MIEFSRVHYTYAGQSSPAIRELSLVIREGETLCIIGRNGSGKSTLCRLGTGILKPERGCVRVDGLLTAEEGLQFEIRKRVGFLQQNPESQFISVTVEREIASGPENLGFPPLETKTIVEELLTFFRLIHVRKHPPQALSGGQMQKVLLASLLAMRPKYLVLDEPTSYLDPLERLSVKEELKRISRTLGTSIVWVTQFLNEAFIWPRLLAIEQGILCFDGSTEEFLSRKDAQAALGIKNVEKFLPPPLVCEQPD